MSRSRERRYVPTRFETRAVTGSDGSRTIVGHGAVFNRSSLFLQDWAGGFVEQVDPGAFDRTLVDTDTRGLFNHDPNLILGRTTSGTLRLSTDLAGLAYEIDPPDTQAGRDVTTSLDRGDITGSSFSFDVLDEAWDINADGIPQRTLLQIDPLYDVGPVTFPAYPDADSQARSALRHLAEQRSVPLDEAVAFARDGELRRLLKRSDRPSRSEHGLTDAERRDFFDRYPTPAAAHPLLQPAS